MQERSRRRVYFTMMGTCVVLVVLAWNVVRLWSVTASIAMSVVAAVIAPAAAIIGNLGFLDGSSRSQPGDRAADQSGDRPRDQPGDWPGDWPGE